jgi:tetratricopeptide (TPR) repeat protein
MFKRAIDRADEALKLDKEYYEALNLQGFSWRKLGNYKKSLEAYAACLKIQPDYAPARRVLRPGAARERRPRGR